MKLFYARKNAVKMMKSHYEIVFNSCWDNSFVASAPLIIRERQPPRMDFVLSRYCLFSNAFLNKLFRKIILDDEEGKRTLGISRYQVIQVHSKTHRIGTVFLYLFVDETSVETSPGFTISFEMEVLCRGMTFRTSEGIIKHETIAKKQRFEASWRSFKTFFSGLKQSQLLGVVFQSGQDAEFGSTKCRLRDHFARKTSSTIASYFPADRAKVKCQDRYEQLGIFHPVQMDYPLNKTTEVVPLDTSVVDEDIERAMAMSRGEAELEEAIERSKRESHKHHNVDLTGDDDLQRAIESSMSDNNSIKKHKTWQPSDGDLEQAIKNSLKDAKSTSRTGTFPQSGVVDLASESDDEVQIIFDSKPPAKKSEVVELLDDFPRQEEEDGLSRIKRKDPPEKNSDFESKRQATPSLEEKRRLAAEAAARRFASK